MRMKRKKIKYNIITKDYCIPGCYSNRKYEKGNDMIGCDGNAY